jgi:hypothetical protein
VPLADPVLPAAEVVPVADGVVLGEPLECLPSEEASA